MFFAAILGMGLFMVMGPISLIISIPMVLFAGLAKGQTHEQEADPMLAGDSLLNRKGLRPKREWKIVGYDQGKPIIERDHEREARR